MSVRSPCGWGAKGDAFIRNFLYPCCLCHLWLKPTAEFRMNLRIHLCLLACLLAPFLRAQVSVRSEPVGVLSFAVPAGFSGLSFPLIPHQVIAAAVASNTSARLTLAPAAGNVGALLSSGASYYVEITGGPSVGERFDLDAAATIAAGDATLVLALGAGSHSTSTPAPNALAGATAAVRACVTLETLAGLFSPALTGSDDPALADGVRLYGPDGFTAYTLRADGASWAAPNDPADQRGTVIAPEVSIVLELKSGPRQLVQMGAVRTHVFRVNLRPGTQAFAPGFPLDLSAAQIGAAVGANPDPATRWTGSNNAAQADNVEIFDLTAGTFLRYYLRADGASWRRLGRTDDFAAAELFRPDAMIVVRRINADPACRIAPPFTL